MWEIRKHPKLKGGMMAGIGGKKYALGSLQEECAKRVKQSQDFLKII